MPSIELSQLGATYGGAPLRVQAQMDVPESGAALIRISWCHRVQSYEGIQQVSGGGNHSRIPLFGLEIGRREE